MGPWFIVPRQILYDRYAHIDSIYWRDEVSCYKCNKASVMRIYSIDYDSNIEPPAEAIPIVVRYVNDVSFGCGNILDNTHYTGLMKK